MNGVALAAGTGSIALGHIDGVTVRVGGWGPIISEKGGGFDVGQQALTLAATAADDGRASRLAAALISNPGDGSMAGLVRWVYADARWAHVACLAPIVFSLANAGDKEATAIVQLTADSARAKVRTVFQRLLDARCQSLGVPIALAGGLLSDRRSLFAQLLERGLQQEFPESQICWCETCCLLVHG
jgi:N-acetylglucosamine kinase-like BadF-type ATPase